jgi:hypothetical protein
LEPAQRTFERAMDIFPSVAAGSGISRFGVECKLGGDDRAVSQFSFGDELAYHLLVVAVCVAIGGINKIAAGSDIAVKNFSGRLFIDSEAPLRAKRHGAKA